uniref:PARP-type domain-containing protein n=1 Tax=Gongylonema pulchrum TaxID=637853 RepID=A0A183DXU8_9BILA
LLQREWRPLRFCEICPTAQNMRKAIVLPAEGAAESSVSWCGARPEEASGPGRRIRSIVAKQLRLLQKEDRQGANDEGVLRLSYKSSWYHVKCFSPAQMGYEGGTENIAGFSQLIEEDQNELVPIFDPYAEAKKKQQQEEVEAVKTKRAKMEEPDTEERRERLKATFSSTVHCGSILAFVDFYKFVFSLQLLDRLVDCVVFGCPLPCEICKNGHIVYRQVFLFRVSMCFFFSSSEHRYVCRGYISEYTHCSYASHNPPRQPFVVPDEMKEKNTTLGDFEKKVVRLSI